MSHAEYNNIIKQSLYSAKISSMLAQENISVEFSDTASTASFCPNTRTIQFPYNVEMMDVDVHELFIFHEVSHALHIPHGYHELLKAKKVDLESINIVLDIRDERLIKARFPGCVQVMQRGYEKLLSRGFFGKKEELCYKAFPSRLNAYAKLGVKLGAFIPMSAKDMEFYNRCMAAQTMEEVIDLSIELQKLDKEYARGGKELREYIEELLKDDKTDDLSHEELMKRIQEEMDRIQGQRVQEIFDESFKKSILNNAKVINFESIPADQCQYTSAKQYTDYVKSYYDFLDTIMVREMRKDIRVSVDSMVRIFESQKAARRAKLAKVSDTGLVDVNKVFRYKFDDAIFRKSIALPNSKNHGYFILLDMSGSMHSMFREAVDQIIVLTEFLRRIQVPYTVMGFGSSTVFAEDVIKQTNPFECAMMSGNYSSIPDHLFEILNHQQSLADHNLAIDSMIKQRGFGLGGTPTAHAVLAAERVASTFFDSLKIDSRHLVVITDGEPTDCYHVRSGANTLIITDSKTKKHVITSGNCPYGYISALGKVLENRHGIKMTTISLVSALTDRKVSPFVSSGLKEESVKEFRAKKYTKIVDAYTNNPVFFTRPLAVNTEIDDFSIDGKTTTTQIARSLITNMKKVNGSRSFLNALAESLS